MSGMSEIRKLNAEFVNSLIAANSAFKQLWQLVNGTRVNSKFKEGVMAVGKVWFDLPLEWLLGAFGYFDPEAPEAPTNEPEYQGLGAYVTELDCRVNECADCGCLFRIPPHWPSANLCKQCEAKVAAKNQNSAPRTTTGVNGNCIWMKGCADCNCPLPADGPAKMRAVRKSRSCMR